LNSLLNPPLWTKGQGPDSDVILTSRIRLARNLKSHPFPHQATREETVEIAEKLREVIEKNECFNDHKWFNLSDLQVVERNVLVEEHLISPQFCFDISTGRALTYNSVKSEALMINEEDHLRIQVISSGLRLKEDWERANYLDDCIESEIDFAFSPEFGYKTSCPTNMGTAMRASVMLHLPAIAEVDSLSPLIEYVSSLDFSVRGIFGEGSNIVGNIIQLASPISNGTQEKESIEKLERAAFQIIQQERNCREKVVFDNRIKIEDKVHRDFALLASARTLSIGEFFEKYSSVKLGIHLGILPIIPEQVLNELMLFVRPAYLQMIFEPHETEETLNIIRADLVRSMLKNYYN
jgi:protein arginine kinase